MSLKRRRGGRGIGILAATTIVGVAWMTLWMTWSNLQTTHDIPMDVEPDLTPAGMTLSSHKATRILGFSDYNYREYAVRWYHRLTLLGYSEHVVVAVDAKAIEFFQHNSTATGVKWEALPYPPCIGYKHDQRGYRRQIFARRWTYIFEQLQKGYSILMTDVDNVFLRHIAMKTFEDAPVDVFHAYSTSYPMDVFEGMGFTVCGGMSWLRSTTAVMNFVGSLINKCHCKDLVGTTSTTEKVCRDCSCDDQVVLNELLWKGKHKVVWDRNLSKPASPQDYPWEGMTGISSKTKHRVAIWDRNLAYRAVMPDTCPPGNWVAMPLYVDRGTVVETWDALCGKDK